jgi:hypothetical protein
MLLHEAARKNDTVLFQFSIPEKKRKLNGQWQKGMHGTAPRGRG